MRGLQSRVRVRHDATSNLAGTFVRESPPDIGCLNYNFEISRYVEQCSQIMMNSRRFARAIAKKQQQTRLLRVLNQVAPGCFFDQQVRMNCNSHLNYTDGQHGWATKFGDPFQSGHNLW